MSNDHWPSLSYLDALRPEPGWETDFAILSTYSLNLVALVAALLALAGLDDERGSGSKVDFANAIEALRRRVRVLVQKGRVGLPARTPRILGILDLFVQEIPLDEAQNSWHPKVALARLKADEGDATEWRLWLGSRNLTADMNWDVGLGLVGRPGGRGRRIQGAPELGRVLAERAALPNAEPGATYRELGDVRWEMPAGCKVDEIRFFEGPRRSLPEVPKGLRYLAVVSPFLDGSVVRALGQWGDDTTRKLLLSSQRELSKLAAQAQQPLESFDELLYLESADLEELELDAVEKAEADEQGPSSSEDAEPEQRGLHAKLLYAEHKQGRTLWLGSANATQRGWQGPNAEVVARLSVPEEIGKGVKDFLSERARTADLNTLPPDEEDEIEERLEKARREVAARWDVVQRVQTGRLLLDANSKPHPDDAAIKLSVGNLGRTPTRWSREALILPLPPLTRADHSEFLCCQLCLSDKRLSWIQHTPIDPPPDEERDQRALARYLDPRTFLLWIRSLLAGDTMIDGGGDWDAPPGRRETSLRDPGPNWWAPTLEEVLKAWARDPASVTDVDGKVSRYLEVMQDERREDCSEEDRKILDEFRKTWDVLRQELVEADT